MTSSQKTGDFVTRLQEREETYFTTVRGMCRCCREVVAARVFFRDGAVWQQSLCSTCERGFMGVLRGSGGAVDRCGGWDG